MHPVVDAFAQWEKHRPPELAGDPIWFLPAYRLSRFLAITFRKDFETARRYSYSDADQLRRALNSIGRNISEGYGRLHGRERARFFEMALGSAREARECYAQLDAALPQGLAVGKSLLLNRVIKILTTAIPEEREGSSERRMRDAMARRAANRKRAPNTSERDAHEP
jgi:four helix bundle protein